MDANLLNATEVATRLGISRSKVYALAASGDLPSYRIGRLVRFDADDVKQFKARVRRVVMPVNDKSTFSLLRAAGWKG